ncbi:MAG: sugar phosphate isomerase/epimerase family protein [Anaerolineae bacterium]
MSKSRIPIALQLYSVREACQEDFPGTLKAVAEMGYEGVDFAGYYGYDAKTIRSMLDDLGLAVAGCHTALSTLMGEELGATLEFNRILGNRYLIVPWIPEDYRDSVEAWERTAELFNEIAANLEPEGMFTGYHNHHVEFTPYENGQTGWDILASNTNAHVVMQLDLGNALHGGGDPVTYLKRYPGRALTLHLKEYAAGKDKVLIGDGDVAWQEVFDVVESQGATEWYIVEQENYPYPPLESVKRSLDNLRAMGK